MSIAEQAPDGVGGVGGIAVVTVDAPPWARLWARVFDLQLNGMVLTVVALFTVRDFVLSLVALPGGAGLFGLVLTPLALLADAAIQGTFGRTPGKALAGVRVELADGGRPSFTAALKRDALLYVQGLWFGVPVLSLVGMSLAYTKVRAGRATGWDRRAGTRVADAGVNLRRTVLTAVLAFAVAFLANVLAYAIPMAQAAG